MLGSILGLLLNSEVKKGRRGIYRCNIIPLEYPGKFGPIGKFIDSTV